MFEHDKADVTETRVEDVRAGMVRAYSHGDSSMVTDIARRTPRARSYSVSYRSMNARPDGHHNTITIETAAGSWLPILHNAPTTPPPCPPNCEACKVQEMIKAAVAARKNGQ